MKIAKKWLLSILSITLLTSLSAYDSSDYDESIPVDEDLFQLEKEQGVTNPLITYPYQFKLYYDYISRSKLKNCEFEDEKVGFSEGQTQLYYNTFCSQHECLIFGLGYSYTHLNWDREGKFDQATFNNLVLSLGSYTTRIPDWLWQGGMSAEIDTRQWSFSNYTLYYFLLWGRYEYRENIGLHIGTIFRTGLRQNKILPIIGFDWTFCQKWKLSIIYPLDISLNYSINDCWSLSVAGRIWNSRHRLDKHDDCPKSIMEYRNRGIEGAVNYHYTKSLTANLHVGCTRGGDVKWTNSNNRHARTFRFESAVYAGGSFEVRF